MIASWSRMLRMILQELIGLRPDKILELHNKRLILNIKSVEVCISKFGIYKEQRKKKTLSNPLELPCH